jgi:ribA/ribD-fused uncharacterized protein
MYYKAITFGDEKMAEDIYHGINLNHYDMASKELLSGNLSSPIINQWKKLMMSIKKMGRNVSNFDAERWSSESIDIMANCVFHKFSEDEYAMQKLLETGNALICEASPRDPRWGVGVGAQKAVKGQEYWKGKNQLGIILQCIRHAVRNAK